jgi:hypothetical protein
MSRCLLSSLVDPRLGYATLALVVVVVVVVFITPGRTDLIGPVATLSYLRFLIVHPDHPLALG